MKNPFVFLVGCPRSGTTMLKRMVDAHPRIAMTPEIAWIPQRYTERDGVDDSGRATPDLINRLLEKGRLSRYTKIPDGAMGELEKMKASGESPMYADLLSMIFYHLAAERGKELAGNKTVDYSLRVGVLHEIFPEAKFVHIVRDGRDVALSATNWRRADRLAEMHATWSEEPISTAALWWEWHVRKAREEGLLLGESVYHEISYEDLVAAPEEECARMCDFLGIEYSDAMPHYNEGREKDDPNLDAKHAWKPPTQGLRNWRSQMSPDQLESFEAVAGNLLEELDYPRGAGNVSVESAQRAARLRDLFEGRPLPERWQTVRMRG